MYTESKIHGGFLGTIFVIAALIVFFFHTRAVKQELADLNQKQSVLTQEVEALSGKKSELTPKGTLSEVEQKDLAQAIPQHLEQETIIADLNRMAKTANVSFNALSFNLQKTELPTVVISASFQGTPNDIIRFLKLVEVNPRKLTVKDAGVMRSQSVGGLDLVNLNLTLQAFYRTAS